MQFGRTKLVTAKARPMQLSTAMVSMRLSTESTVLAPSNYKRIIVMCDLFSVLS